MKAAKLGWAEGGAGNKQGWTSRTSRASRAKKGRSRVGQEQGRNRNNVGAGKEQGIIR